MRDPLYIIIYLEAIYLLQKDNKKCYYINSFIRKKTRGNGDVTGIIYFF